MTAGPTPSGTKLAAGAAGVVHIVVRAESEDDQQYEWRETLAITDKVSKVANDWATAHGVPSSSVGFDDMNNMEVPLQETPADLGWIAGQEVELKAYPTEDRYMEQAGEQGAVPDDDAAKGENEASDGQGAEEAVNDSEQAAVAASAPLEAKAAAPASRAERPKAAASSSSKAEAKSAPRAKATASKSSTRGASSVPAAAASDAGGMPGDSEDIVFEQANPKREGSGAFERYEKYKRARTVGEALSLGAVKGDIAHDYKKGFLKRRRAS